MDDEVTRKIFSILLHIYDKNDYLCWGLNAHGRFSVKSATWVQNVMTSDDSKNKLLNKMWKLNIPNKVKIFSWLLILNKLHTRSKIHKFINTISETCLLCNRDAENQYHLFINCEYAKQIWTYSPKIKPPPNQSSCNLFEWLGFLDSNDGENLSSLSFALIMCWQIWKMRNNMVFNKVKVHPSRVVTLAFNMANDCNNANKKDVVSRKNQDRLIKMAPFG